MLCEPLAWWRRNGTLDGRVYSFPCRYLSSEAMYIYQAEVRCIATVCSVETVEIAPTVKRVCLRGWYQLASF